MPPDVATRADLDRVEFQNVIDARLWAMGRTWTVDALLDTQVLRGLHRRMFGEVWRWAGDLRLRETNVGVAPGTIPVALRDLLDDARAWCEHGTYPADETALRLHHRLAQVHPFANGNGRHARLCADLLVRALGRPVFAWSGDLSGDAIGRADVTRERYLAALRAMDRDREDVAALLAFARG
jgi:Fic-DOC domain mobile mystery protein B